MSTSDNQTLTALMNALKTIDSKTFYGMASKLQNGAAWNYIVFSRESDMTANDRNRITEHYIVSIVRENFIPEGLVDEVADVVRAIPGFKDAGDGTEYFYDVKPGTTDVVEMAVMHFTRGRKR